MKKTMFIVTISLISACFIIKIINGETAKPPLVRDYGVEFYCSPDDDVYLKFGGNAAQTLPRILGVSAATGICDQWSQGDIVQMRCGYNAGPVSMILEYDETSVYSLARVSCPQRTRRAGFNVSADATDDQFGKTIAKVNVNLEYNNNSEITINCNVNGNVYVTNPDSKIYKHVFAYNKGGPICTALVTRENVVEISNCEQMRTMEVIFSTNAFNDNIIGGSTDMRFYKFDCKKIGQDELLLEEVESILRRNGAPRLVTWSTVVFCITGTALNIIN